jgi:glycyl-tRNA synthetase beta chain
MTDFLLELRSEEIPARMQGKAKLDLEALFLKQLSAAELHCVRVETFATPRRLALIAHGLPDGTQSSFEDIKGPRVGAPQQAVDGFLKKYGLSENELVQMDGVWFARLQKPGRKTADVLAEAIPAIVRAFPWPKSQRWGAASISTESLRWVRPLQGIVALLGDDVVDCEIEGIASGRETMGHRFHSSGPISIANAGAYVETLRAAHVIVHFSERARVIREGAEAAAKAAGLVLVGDEGLVAENAGLTEWPVPMLGRFDPAFLAVPEEVIQLTARVNQKYFVCHDTNGKLANAFVCTANIVANDGGVAIVAGNEKVLAARLSDAKFFWEQDLKIPLDEQAKKLSQITFHEKLGTVADKVERVAKLARWLVTERIVKSSPLGEGNHAQQGGGARAESPDGEGGATTHVPLHQPAAGPPPRSGEDLADQAERAARLCKADLVTGMVGEFPELQGIMGGYYARAQGEADAVADAVRDHYKPVGQGDDVPTAPVTVAVSLADKLDTLFGFFAKEMAPTGSRDPFALRRAGLSVISLLTANNIRLPLIDAFVERLRNEHVTEDEVIEAKQKLRRLLADNDIEQDDGLGEVIQLLSLLNVVDFFADRLKVQQREAGVRHDLIDAVFALGGEDDLVRLLARVKALQAFVGTDEGGNLLAGYKRAANILKSSPLGEGDHAQHGGGARAESPDGEGEATTDVPLHQPAAGPPPRSGEDLELESALNTAEPLATTAIEAEKFEGAMAALASLRAPIDAFFEGVMVNDPDPAKRAYRLGLLARFRDAVHRVADFSRIEG